MNWFSKLIGLEKRRFRRHPDPPLMAFYWDGGLSTPHEVLDISQGGLFIRTDDRWYPRTLMRVTLQRTSNDPLKADESIALQCRVVRAGVDGIGMAIMYTEEDKSDNPVILGSTATRREFTKFLRRILADATDETYPPYQQFAPILDRASPPNHTRIQ